MDRNIVYPGSIPLDTDLLATNRHAMVALGALIQAVLGNATVVDGLAVAPTIPASMAVLVGPGSIAQLATVDGGAYGSLPADTASALMKMGVNLRPTSFTVAAPTTSGQSVMSLIEASFQEADVDPVVLPYYNAANPAQPYLGPNNAGTAQNTRRVQLVQLQLKPGVPATTGSQVAPAVDAGWVGLATVSVAYGQTSVTAVNISAMATAPAIAFKLPALRPGFSTIQSYTGSGSFTVPAGVTRVRVRAIGGGGGGGNTTSGGGGGGGGGGLAEGVYVVAPGQVVAVTVGGGGGGGANNSGSAAGNNGSGGAASSFGAFLAASGGTAGTGSLAGGQGNSGPGGSGSGGQVNMTGGAGNAGFNGGAAGFGGMGGAAAGGGGNGAASSGLPSPGSSPGGGGAGAGGNFGGASGAAGIVIVEY